MAGKNDPEPDGSSDTFGHETSTDEFGPETSTDEFGREDSTDELRPPQR